GYDRHEEHAAIVDVLRDRIRDDVAARVSRADDADLADEGNEPFRDQLRSRCGLDRQASLFAIAHDPLPFAVVTAANGFKDRRVAHRFFDAVEICGAIHLLEFGYRNAARAHEPLFEQAVL